MTDVSPIASFRAGLDATALSSFLDVTADLTAGGSFEFSPRQMDEIFGAPLPDGSHTLHLQAAEIRESVWHLNLSFTLDTRPPAVAIESPAQGLVVAQNVVTAGNVADQTSSVVRLQAQVDGGALTDASVTPKVPSSSRPRCRSTVGRRPSHCRPDCHRPGRQRLDRGRGTSPWTRPRPPSRSTSIPRPTRPPWATSRRPSQP